MRNKISIFQSLYLLFGYHWQVLEGSLQDVRQRYTGSLFGLLWAVLFPLLQLSVYSGLYIIVFKIRPSGLTETGYVMLVFSGLVPIMAFNEAIIAAASSLITNKNLLLNSVFPVELIPVRSVIAAQVPSLAGLAMTLIAGFILGRTGLQAIFLVPIFWVLLMVFAMGVGWVLSMLSLVARDIQHSLGIITMLLLILSPFAYTPAMVPPILKPILYLNPLSYFVLTFQDLICYGVWPSLLNAVLSLVIGLGAFLAGFAIFKKVKYIFIDHA